MKTAATMKFYKVMIKILMILILFSPVEVAFAQDLQEIRQQLVSEDKKVQRKAMRTLNEITPITPEVANLYVHGLKSPWEVMRAGHLQYLAYRSIGPKAEGTIPAILRLFADKEANPNARNAVPVTLGALAKYLDDAFPELLNIVKNNEEDVWPRLKGIKALGDLGPFATPANRSLMKLAEDKNQKILSLAAKIALARINPNDKRMTDYLIQILMEAPRESIPIPGFSFSSEYFNASNLAADTLHELGLSHTVLPVFPKLLKSFPPDKKFPMNNAFAILSKVRPVTPEVVAHFTQGMSHPEENYRSSAKDYLCRLGPKAHTAVPEILKYFSNREENQMSRINIPECLRSIGPASNKVIPSLIKVAQDKREEILIRYHAIRSLGKLGSEARESLPALDQVRNSSEHAVIKDSALFAMVNINPEDKRLLNKVIEIVKGPVAKPHQMRVGVGSTSFDPEYFAMNTVVRNGSSAEVNNIMIELLKSGDQKKKFHVLRSLRSLKPESESVIMEAIKILKRKPINRSDKQLRGIALMGLMSLSFESQNVVQFFYEEAKDANSPLQKIAIKYMASLEASNKIQREMMKGVSGEKYWAHFATKRLRKINEKLPDSITGEMWVQGKWFTFVAYRKDIQMPGAKTAGYIQASKLVASTGFLPVNSPGHLIEIRSKLKSITGREFRTKREFDEWLEDNRENLQYSEKLDRLVITKPNK